MIVLPSFSHELILVLFKWTIPVQLIDLYLEWATSNLWIPVEIFWEDECALADGSD